MSTVVALLAAFLEDEGVAATLRTHVAGDAQLAQGKRARLFNVFAVAIGDGLVTAGALGTLCALRIWCALNAVCWWLAWCHLLQGLHVQFERTSHCIGQ